MVASGICTWHGAQSNHAFGGYFLKEIKDSLEEVEEEEQPVPVRILRLWKEQWENEKLGPQGNHILEARLMNKYGGMKFCDIDEDIRVMTVHKMVFVKQRGNNEYRVFATLPGYNSNIGDHEPANDPYWMP